MSQAFVKENDDLWLHDISPTIQALIEFLTQENGGVHVYEKQRNTDAAGREVYVMSNGLTYAKDDRGKWEVVI